ncbi:hypothetical protein D3C85_1892790 [compost metagenome]
MLDKEAYALVGTVADRENESAKLYTQIHALIQQQVEAREQLRAATRLQNRG